MFSDPLVASVDVDSGAAVTASYTVINNLNRATDRVNTNAAAGDPKVLKISHTDVGKGVSARKRHMVRLEAYSVAEGVEVPSVKASLYLVADIPASGITAAQEKKLWQQFVGLLRGASGNVTYDSNEATFFTRFLNGEA